MTRNRLYLLLSLGLLAGYGWLIWASWQTTHHSDFTPCFFKNATGIACPSCGVTRSVLQVSHGHITEAILLNPLGLIMAAIMITAPFWLLYDVILKKDTLYTSYKKTEQLIRIKWVAIILIILILINWAWNIQKGL
ncbi:DUF2752 domain-containing protein [Flavobacterium suzhouense]|uniref:DUF2752 domain-containing protein n=1 Tax=Flavobacterium suzhouense TaxID=1529638 RepID=A0ABW5NXI3_9FLAO